MNNTPDPNQRFEPNKTYCLQGEQLNRIWQVAQRLYSEKRLQNGDEYRDLAQSLDSSLNETFDFEW